MKSFIALCFLAAICAMQASAYNPLDQLKAAVDTSKRNVESIVSDLKRTKTNLAMTTNSKLSNLRSQSIVNINNIVNPALTEIRASVDAAKAEGKDVEHCYTTAQDSLRSISSTAYSGVQTCETTGNSQLQQKLAPLDTAMATGQAYLTQLNSVFLDCYQSNILQMQTCIAIKLGQINQSIRSYQSEVNTLKLNAQRGVNDVTNAAFSCNMEPVSTARSATTDVRIATNRCIKN